MAEDVDAAASDVVEATELSCENTTDKLTDYDGEMAASGDATDDSSDNQGDADDGGQFVDDPAQKRGLTEADITLSTGGEYTYTGVPIEPELSVMVAGVDDPLVENTDYTVSYSNNTAAGRASITVTGMDAYEGERTVEFEIIPASIKGATIGALETKAYTGKAQTQGAAVVELDGVVLQKGIDYTVSYQNNLNAGTATFVATGTGNYAGVVSKTFSIGKASIEGAAISGFGSRSYTGKARTQGSAIVAVGGVRLKKDTDYTVSYENNVKAGTATFVATGKGNYAGTAKKTFRIAARPFAKAKVSGIKNKTYTGKKLTQSLVVKWGSATLRKGTDYTVSYKNNLKAGKATVTLVGKGNYLGKKTLAFEIAKANFSKAKVAAIGKQLYTGKAITPAVKVAYGKLTLKKGTDYTVTYKIDKALGTAAVTVTGKGSFTAVKKKVTFKIYRANVSKATVGGLSSYYYTGGSIRPNPTVTYGGKTLRKGRDYSLSYSNNRLSYSNNRNGGWAIITIRGKRGFKGTKKVQFWIDGPSYYGYTDYVTNTGTKYHRAGCRYLHSSHAVDLGVALWEGYDACGVCNP